MRHARELVAATANCAWCPTLCLHACPVVTAEASDVVSPWGKMSLARWLAQDRTALDEDSAAVLYKCTGCGACQSACRHHVDVSGALLLAREDAVSAGVNAWPAAQFAAPIESPADLVMPVGVSGYALWAAGFRARFEVVAAAAASRWASRSELVFESAEDVACVEKVYPEMGLSLSAHIMLRAERGESLGELEGPVAYHEACHLARGDEARAGRVREQATKAAGGELVELRWHGDGATCCGGGGAYPMTSPDGAKAAAERVLDNALLKGARTLVTGCGGCAAHLKAACGPRSLSIVQL